MYAFLLYVYCFYKKYLIFILFFLSLNQMINYILYILNILYIDVFLLDHLWDYISHRFNHCTLL